MIEWRVDGAVGHGLGNWGSKAGLHIVKLDNTHVNLCKITYSVKFNLHI